MHFWIYYYICTVTVISSLAEMCEASVGDSSPLKPLLRVVSCTASHAEPDGSSLALVYFLLS